MTPGGLIEVRVSWPEHPRYLKIIIIINKLKKKEKETAVSFSVLTTESALAHKETIPNRIPILVMNELLY